MIEYFLGISWGFPGDFLGISWEKGLVMEREPYFEDDEMGEMRLSCWIGTTG